MKNLFSLVFVLGLGLMLLPGCGSSKKSCCAKTTCCETEKRVSGPIQKEVGWTEEDLK